MELEIRNAEALGECYEIINQQRLEIERLRAAQYLVNEQAENEGLWFVAKYATEAYLQSELRRLHEVIEGKSSKQCAQARSSNQGR